MEDIYLKYGLFFLGFVVVVLLISFSLRHTELGAVQQKHSVKNLQEFKAKALELCKACLDMGADKDCFLLETHLDASLEDNFAEGIFNPRLDPGDHLIKISAKNNECLISRLS